MKIAYIGIDLLYPALPALYDRGCDILKIFTCRTDNVTEFNIKITEFAGLHGIPITMERISLADLKILEDMGCELIVSAGYYYMIPVDTKIKMINIHPTMLPTGRGAWPMPRLIMDGYKEGGVTFHKIIKEADAGDIVLQRCFNIDKNENHKTYMNKVHLLLDDMVDELLDKLDELYNNALPQGEGSYFADMVQEDYTVEESMTVQEADVILRAFYGYECIYRSREGVYEIIEAYATYGLREGKNVFKLKDGYIEARTAREIMV